MIVVSEFKSPIELGIDPPRELAPKFRYVKSVRLPRPKGIDPVNLLAYISQ
jgi:hypothetical protein